MSSVCGCIFVAIVLLSLDVFVNDKEAIVDTIVTAGDDAENICKIKN